MAISQEDMIKAIEEMTVLEVSELVKALEEKFGVSASAPMMAMPAGAAAGADAETEEQSEFDVILKDVGDSKIKVIKEVRAITGLGLKEAKSLVDEAPKAIKEGVDKDEAEELKKRLSDVGATVELK